MHWLINKTKLALGTEFQSSGSVVGHLKKVVADSPRYTVHQVIIL